MWTGEATKCFEQNPRFSSWNQMKMVRFHGSKVFQYSSHWIQQFSFAALLQMDVYWLLFHFIFYFGWNQMTFSVESLMHYKTNVCRNTRRFVHYVNISYQYFVIGTVKCAFTKRSKRFLLSFVFCVSPKLCVCPNWLTNQKPSPIKIRELFDPQKN